MQLPRGTFHSIKKKIYLWSLLDEMEKTRFTGFCLTSLGTETFTLVLNSGDYILAEYDKLEGDPAWQKIQKLLDMKVDASLTTLNAVQLQLAREFNPHAKLPSFIRKSPAKQVKIGLTSPESGHGAVMPGLPEHGALLHHKEGKGVSPSTDTLPAGVGPGRKPPLITNMEVPCEQQPADTGMDDSGTNIERDLKALDNMDLDEMSKKIRESCKITIEHLDLDYLITNRED